MAPENALVELKPEYKSWHAEYGAGSASFKTYGPVHLVSIVYHAGEWHGICRQGTDLQRIPLRFLVTTLAGHPLMVTERVYAG